MSARRRILRIALYVVLSLALVGLWAFGHFFFYPWEAGYRADLSSLIPRDVGFYVSKADLRKDFKPFPRLSFADEFEASRHGKALRRTETYQELFENPALANGLAELETMLAQMPIQVSPLELFGGRDLAAAGYFKGASLETADWAFYGRVNWMGKLAYQAIFGGFFDVASQGMQAAPLKTADGGERIGISISGGQLQRPIHLTRIQDVLIAASETTLVQKAHELVTSKGENSLLLSAKYGDHIGRKEREGDELEVYVDYRDLSESLRMPGNWPDPFSKDLGTALAGKFFQLGSIREVAGTIGFGRNVHLELTADLSTNMLTPVQKTLYREADFSREDIAEVAQWVPADAGLFLYGHADVGDILRQLVGSLDNATLSNLEDVVRTVWGYADVHPLIEDFEAMLRDRFAFAVRNYDFPKETGDKAPPSNDTPVPAWVLILWVEDPEEVERLREVIKSHQSELGLQGRQPGSPGLWNNRPGGSATLTEYWNPLIPGTGHLATLRDRGRAPYLMVSNENRLLDAMFKTYRTGGEEYPRLSEDPVFSNWVSAGLASANLLAWLNPRAMGDTLRTLARYGAQLGLLDGIDWSKERPRIEREVLQEHFPGERWPNVSPDNRDQYEKLVQDEVDRFQADFERRNASIVVSEADARVEAWEVISEALLELATDRKRIQVHGRIGLEQVAE